MEVKIIVPKFPNGIAIGEERENLAVPVVVDYTAWVEQHGAGALQILLQRPQDADPYPVTVTNDNGEAVWTPNETDMNFKGRGEIQLVYTAGGVIERSPVIMVISGRSLVAAGDPPDPFETWLEELTELAAETQQNAIDAAGSAEAAGTSAGAAAGSAGKAKAAAEEAEESVTHYPVIINGYWCVWDVTSGEYVSTGIKAQGPDGFSPTVVITAITGGHRVTITDANGPHVFDVLDGAKGDKGDPLTYDDLTEEQKADLVQGPILDAQNDAIAAVEAKGEEVIESIPDFQKEIDKKAPAIYESIGPAAIAYFADGADDMPIKALTVDIPATQSGAGDPSPENVRPIVGHTRATVMSAGANLLPLTLPGDAFAGTFGTGSTSIASATNARCWCIYVGENCDLRYQNASTGAAVALAFAGQYFTSRDGAVIYDALTVTNRDTAINSGTHPYLVVNISNAALLTPGGALDARQCMLSFGAGRKAYAPRTDPTTLEISFAAEAGTVYGGMLTINADGSGDLLVTKAAKRVSDLAGNPYINLNMLRFDSISSLFPGYIFSTPYTAPNAKASMLRGVGDSPIAGTDAYRGTFAFGRSIFWVSDNTCSTVADYLAKYGDCLIVWDLDATHQTTYHISDAGQVKTLLGTNNIWSNAGDVTAEYPADTKSYIDKSIRATRQLIAGIETGMTASRAYSVGELLIVGDMLYSVIVAIANGATLTPGTNVTATTVAEQLLLLANL